MKKIFKSFAVIATIFLLTALTLIIYYNYVLPDKYYVKIGSELKLDGVVQAINHNEITAEASLSNDIILSESKNAAELKFMGVIPIKTVSVEEIETPMLIPCGEPFGIKLLTDGVVVVEVNSFESYLGLKSPAGDAGIKSGDVIKTIDGEKIFTNVQIGEIIAESDGEALEVVYNRNDTTLKTTINPQKSTSDDCYKAGIWVRDSSAGIGTLTYYDPLTKEYGGLGHPVCDIDTGQIMPISTGEVVNVGISGVKKGVAGTPGELIGGFISFATAGSVEINNETGVFGHLYNFTPQNEAFPIALSQEIETGKAYIYSTILGTKPEMYEIEIDKIDFNNSENSKNLVITVTDETLIEKTGGIVQGMSGSPIVQNGKIIGAVTHVFVKNPSKGYGIFIENMLKTADNLQ